MPETMTIAVVGAGVMGRLLAWQLRSQGHRVSVFEKDTPQGESAAGFTAAGMLTPFCELESAESQVFELGMRSLDLWPQIMQQLGGGLGFYANGSLVLAHPQDRADLGRFKFHLRNKLDPDQCRYEWMSQERLAQVEPELATHFGEATYIPNEAWLDPVRVLERLKAKSIEAGVRWFHGADVGHLNASHFESKGKRHSFDLAIDCRGLGAKADIPQLRGVRGEVIWLEAPGVRLTHLVRLMHPRYRLYIVPRIENDLYVIGATQIESDDTAPITVRSALELLSAAYSVSSGFGEARIVQTRVNCRPAMRDNLPKIESGNGLIRVNGLYRHGFLLAPSVSEKVQACMASGDAFMPSTISATL